MDIYEEMRFAENEGELKILRWEMGAERKHLTPANIVWNEF